MIASSYEVEFRAEGWIVLAMPQRRRVLRPMTEPQARRLAASLNRNISARQRANAIENAAT